VKNYQRVIGSWKEHAVISVTTLLAVLCLASCNAGQANVGGPQQPIFVSAPGSPVAIACGASNVAVGDLNKDGKPDLVVTCGQAHALTVLLGTGGGPAGDFRAPNPIPLPDSPGDIVLGDLNGDGNMDVLRRGCDAR
jgi:FG-GAP-like repeat